MAFQLSAVLPWGRSYDEYLAMFALTREDLGGRILGCGDGPAAFNAGATQRGSRVLSVDPLYACSAEQIGDHIATASIEIADQTRRNAHEFVWTQFASVDELIAARLDAMQTFLADYPGGQAAGRYLTGSLPDLPLADDQFDVAVCANLLFLYSSQLDLDFHVASLLEMSRLARDVRVFPLLELGSVPSRHLQPATTAVRERGLTVETVPVAYELQRGGNHMLRITSRR
jgi:hypothetical protein